jgi:ketosteroid isomerase-like protein
VADHDAAAFAQHVDEQAAFSSGQPQPQRGRAFIAQQWAGIIAGTPVRVEWYPTRVTIAGRPDIAWSSGPALYENLEPGAKERFRLGGFRSVWSRGGDGVWRVLFDDGIRSSAATDEQVAAFRAGRQDCTSLTSP